MSIRYIDKDGIEHQTAGKEVPGVASNTKFGVVQFSESENVTSNNGLALSAKEKNPNILGTLANKIKSLFSKMGEEDIAVGDGTVSNAINVLSEKTAGNRSYKQLLSSTMRIPYGEISQEIEYDTSENYDYIEIQYYAQNCGIRDSKVLPIGSANFLVATGTDTNPTMSYAKVRREGNMKIRIYNNGGVNDILAVTSLCLIKQS